jgi:hypothetical protein
MPAFFGKKRMVSGVSFVPMAYFPLLYRWRGEERLLLWQPGNIDSVAVGSEGHVQSFAGLADLNRFAHVHALQIEQEEPKLHNLDSVQAWARGKEPDVNCDETLNAWNLFRDIANSVEGPCKESFEKLDSDMSEVYNKIFWGNNLPATTPRGERFVPTWSAEEIDALAALLSAGLSMLTSCTQNAKAEAN